MPQLPEQESSNGEGRNEAGGDANRQEFTSESDPRTHAARENTPTPERSNEQSNSPKGTRGRLVIAASALGVLLVGGGAWFAYTQLFSSTPLERAYEACEGDKPIKGFLADLKDESTDASNGDDQDAADERDNGAFDEYFEGVLALEDSGKTLIVSTKPKDDDPLGVSSLAVECVVNTLEIPKWLSESISTTRALDGRQTAEWDQLSAQWGYHPDNGLNLIITTK